MNKYIHTLGGKPAYFDRQLWYANQGVSLDKLLVDDLQTIRRQEKASAEWRKSQGMQPDYGTGFTISYLRVKL